MRLFSAWLLVLLAGGPIGAFFAGLVLMGAFFAVLAEFVFLFDSLVAPTCGYPSLASQMGMSIGRAYRNLNI